MVISNMVMLNCKIFIKLEYFPFMLGCLKCFQKKFSLKHNENKTNFGHCVVKLYVGDCQYKIYNWVEQYCVFDI